MGRFVERTKEEHTDELGNFNVFFHGVPSTPRDGRPVAIVDDIEQKVYRPLGVNYLGEVAFYEDKGAY